MARPRTLDTNRLIRHWRHRCRGPSANHTVDDARGWARELIESFRSDSLLTPVEIEFLGGVRDRAELALAEAFLDTFRKADEGDIRWEDWAEARRLARRVPRDGRPRHLGDCLIQAIATRLRFEVLTSDRGMPR